jgi:hypothetical protein
MHSGRTFFAWLALVLALVLCAKAGDITNDSTNAASPAPAPPEMSSNPRTEAEIRNAQIQPPPVPKPASSPSHGWKNQDVLWFLCGVVIALGFYRWVFRHRMK